MTAIHEEGAPRNSRAFLIVFLAFLSAFGPFVTDFYLPTLPDQTVDFGAPASMVQLGLSATMWGLAAGQLWIGPLSDTRGRRIPLAASLAVFSLATAGAVFAPDIETFIAMRFLEGLGASGAVVMSRSIAADLHAGRELATLMAVVGAIQGIAPVTAPMIGALRKYLMKTVFIVCQKKILRNRKIHAGKRVQVLALQVFDQRHFHGALLVGREDAHRHLPQPGHAAGAFLLNNKSLFFCIFDYNL